MAFHWRTLHQSSLLASRQRKRVNVTSRSECNNTLSCDRLHASNVATKNLTRRSLAAFTRRAAAVDWLFLSNMFKDVKTGLPRCTRRDKNMKSHSTQLVVHCSRLSWEEGNPTHDLRHSCQVSRCGYGPLPGATLLVPFSPLVRRIQQAPLECSKSRPLPGGFTT